MSMLTTWFVILALSWNASVAVRDLDGDAETQAMSIEAKQHKEHHLPPKDIIGCQVCMKLGSTDVDCDTFVADKVGFSEKVNGWVDGDLTNLPKTKGKARQRKLNLMDVIGNIHPSDLTEWTNPRRKGAPKGANGQVKFSQQSIDWMLGELLKKGVAYEPDTPNSDYRRALKHLSSSFNDNNDKTTMFCNKIKQVTKKSECTANWQDDSEKLFKDRAKKETLHAGANRNDYCSCVVQDINPRQWSKIAFHNRTKCDIVV